MATTEARRAARDEANADALARFLKQMDRDRPGEVRRLSDDSGLELEVVPTGAISLDVALGVGGFPLGRIIELYGEESSGKTSLALAVAANLQKLRGGVVGFVDAEHALTLDHAKAYGVDLDTMVINQPSCGEDGLAMVEEMCKSGAFEMVIVDSVAALTPRAEIEGEMGEQRVGAHARMMSQALRRLVGVVSDTNTMVVFVNQLRLTPTAYGDPRVTTGGKALKFYASIRIEVSSPKSKKLLRDGVPYGQTCTAKVVKNKVGPPLRQAEYDIIFDAGISAEGSLIDVAKQLGVVTVRGATHTETATGEVLGVGREKCKARLVADPEVRERLTAACYAALKGGGAVEVELVDPATLDDADPEGAEFVEEPADGTPSAA